MSDVPVWFPGVFPDIRPLWPTQVSAVINLHRSKLPPIPNEGRRRSVWGCRRERKKETEDKGERKRGRTSNIGRKVRRWRQEKQPRIDEDSDGS